MKTTNLAVRAAPAPAEADTARAESLQALPASRCAANEPAGPNPLRRVLDFSAAVVLSVIALPVVALAALAVRLTSRGPAFYTQTRTGKNGVTFTIYKLRSMVDKCESLTGPRWTMPGDPRITPVGWLLRRTPQR